MKAKILIPSLIFLIITTGLSLYHLFYLNGFKSTQYSLDLSDFRSADLELNEEIFRIRATMGANPDELDRAFEKFKNQKNIVLAFLKEANIDPTIKSKFEIYFEKKQNSKNEIAFAINSLNKNLNELNPLVNKLPKQNIKFVIDGRDFYKELVINAHRYALSPSAENTERFIEDKKILQQIKAYSNIEIFEINQLKDFHDGVFDKVNLLNAEFNLIRTVNLEKEINTISQNLAEGLDENSAMKRNFLILSIVSSLLYTAAIFFFM